MLSLLLKPVTVAQLQYLICICRKALKKTANFEWKGQKIVAGTLQKRLVIFWRSDDKRLLLYVLFILRLSWAN
jgi:hypothetical protein